MYRGFFINLPSNESRRNALTNHLKAINALERYQRVEAIDGRAVSHQYPTTLDPGSLGLWLTHLGIIRDNSNSPVPLHIIEDDTLFAAGAIELLESSLNFADGKLGDWDLIFTDIHMPIDFRIFERFSSRLELFKSNAQLTLLPMGKILFSGTSSIVVNHRSIKKYLELMSDGWKSGVAIDLFLRKLIAESRLSAYLVLPFITSASPDTLQSDIRGQFDRSRAVMMIYRRAFFKDADLSGLQREMAELVRGAGVSPITDLYLNTLMFYLSDQWKGF